MADVILTFKVMPSNVAVNLQKARSEIEERIKHFGGSIGKVEEVPVAFGLKSLNIIFIMDENVGSTEDLEKEIAQIKGVGSVDVIDVRRAVG
ncbi:elongation factor 1-beta [Candidatus Woesearchaeota archaeon]|nr:elongation factor 1-beta [Candidatus Woesearchaeota archaeon]